MYAAWNPERACSAPVCHLAHVVYLFVASGYAQTDHTTAWLRVVAACFALRRPVVVVRSSMPA
eukprot:COSAG06_NODE_2480_length_6788_cov_3.392084_6_plen_63_part_00